MKLLWSICIAQCLLILVLYFGDIGFDKPGRFGLDFDHLLILIVTQACLFVVAITTIIRNKQWKYISLQFLLLAATAVGVVLN